jgi:hypothetical protein
MTLSAGLRRLAASLADGITIRMKIKIMKRIRSRIKRKSRICPTPSARLIPSS